MKKIFFISIIVGIGIYFFLERDSNNTSVQRTNDKIIEKDSQSISKKIKTEAEKIDSSNPDLAKATSEEDFDKISEYLEDVQINWINGIENLFMSDAQNGEVNLAIYKDMKSGYEAEREKRYQEFHRKMREEHGSEYSYSPSVDEEMFNEKLVKAYELSLSEKIGEKMMINYMSLKDQFNQDLESKSKSRDDFYTNIEF